MEKESPSALPTECCHSCKFMRLSELNSQTMKREMLCARFPPLGMAIITNMGPAVTTVWPVIDPGKWCGEWTAKPVDLAKAN